MYLAILFIIQLVIESEEPQICGIVGAIAKKPYGFYSKDSDAFQQMLYADTLRGWDATGVFGVTKGNNVDVAKAAVAGPYFICTPDFEKFKKDMVSNYKMVVGHNRKATHGEKNSEEAHPFWSEDNNIVLVHNGMISNHKEFCKDSTVDSQAVCNALQDKTPQEVFSKLEGSYAIVWYNVKEHKMYFIRNDARPLSFVHTDDTVYFMSEPEMGAWLLKRTACGTKEIKHLQPRMLYSIELSDTVIVEEGVIEMEKKPFAPYTYQTHQPNGNTNGTTKSTGAGKSRTKYFAANDPAGVPASLNAFFTKDDIRDASDAMRCFNRNTQTIFVPISYDERKETVTVTGHVINCDVDFLECNMIVSRDIFKDLDLTLPILVDISAVVRTGDVVTLYVNKPRMPQAPMNLTPSDTMITEDMYYDDVFPMECDCCNKSIQFKDIPNTEIFFDNGAATCVICSTCLASPQTQGAMH